MLTNGALMDNFYEFYSETHPRMQMLLLRGVVGLLKLWT